MGKVNKRIFNPMELKRGKRPVLIHSGRMSGKTYYTPLDAHQVEGGYIFIVMYSSESDWVKNIQAAGGASLRIADVEQPLTNPRLISLEEAFETFGMTAESKTKLNEKAEYFRMDAV